MQNNRKKILFISQTPPPIGGISIHVFRLMTYLQENFWEVVCVRPTIRNLPRIILKTFSYEMIHIHSLRFYLFSWPFWYFLRIFLDKKIIVTVHSYRKKSVIVPYSLRKASQVIAVNEEILNSIGVPRAKKIPPFLAPHNKERDFFLEIPKEARCFFKRLRVIAFNAWKIVYEDGEDLYGVNLILSAFGFLRQKLENIGLCLCIPQLDANQKQKLLKSLDEKNIPRKDVLILDFNVSFCDVLRLSDVFVRPTRSDGDSLSVKEALYLGVPTIATNVVPRHGDVFLSEYAVTSLVETLERVLALKKYSKSDAIKGEHGKNLSSYLEMLSHL